MQRNNEEIRRLMGFYGIRQWEIGREIGVREETVSKWFRTELSKEQREKVMNVINKLIALKMNQEKGVEE